MRDAAATDNDSTDGDELWEGAAVPHLMAHQTDVDAFKEQILQGLDAPITQSIALRPVSPNIPLRPVQWAANSPRRHHRTRWGMHSIHNPLHRLNAPQPSLLRAFSLRPAHRPRKRMPPMGHQLHPLQDNQPC
ncbi:hypothetical protein E4U60_007359, partial [Claviceps pazoutovae]